MSDAIMSRVEELLSRMTLQQKVGQMIQAERMAVTPEQVKEYHLGSVLSGGGSCPGDNRTQDWVDMNDAYWIASMEQDDEHLAIPILYGVDAIHGNANVLGATVFPHNIGLGACNDPELIQRIATITAREVLATGLDWSFAPTLAVAKDAHWGRTYESYSEDANLVASYAGAFVIGFQGDMGDDAAIACAKHWVGDGGTLNGIDQGNFVGSYEELDSEHMKPYLPALDAGVLTVMASFNSWNGDKLHGHHHLITEVLKNQMGFGGFVISDWDGVDYLHEDLSVAIRQSVNAGLDMFMVSEDWQRFWQLLLDEVNAGNVLQSRIDDAVRRILTVKTKFGLFEKPRPSKRVWSNHSSFGSYLHRDVAREAVRKSLVLLKNDDQLLPLKKDAKILVAGQNADNVGHQCGGFTVAWQGTSGNEEVIGGTSIWAGIQRHAPNAELSVDGSLAQTEEFDVAIAVIGERPYAEGLGDLRADDNVIVEAGSQIKGAMKVLEPYGSSLELSTLHPEDLATIERIAEQGIPVVCVLVSGRPLVTNREMAASKAFMAAWLPGSEGLGVAEVLFGDFDFRGRLSFAWPRHERAYERSHQPEDDFLFPVGYGLDYTANQDQGLQATG